MEQTIKFNRIDLSKTNEFLTGDTARELDYYRIRDTIASLCVSPEGKEQLLKREPLTDFESIEELKKLGREWNTYINSNRPQAVVNWPEVENHFKVLGIQGSSLNQEDLFALGLFASAAVKAKDCITSASIEFSIPALSELVSFMPDLSQAKNDIFAILTPEGEVKDLPRLREIRSKIAALHREVENAIRKYTSSSDLQNALQSNVPAYRSDRELLAVKAEHKNSIKGIVHEVSASGSTVYIEPEDVVRANNDLIQEEFRLYAETKKILTELTETIGKYKHDFIEAHKTMILLDMTMAAGRWQNQVHGIFAEHCDMEKEPPVIFEARHPLLGDKAVPISITFLDGKKVLVVTGPNTGGKTVTLKTVALFSLLNQAGFPIPASEGTRLPIFHSIFADIGDEQSIDESLSTFSSHMKRVAQMVNFADSKSLILLDELGSGTDPMEGSAIAMATLDNLIQKDAFVLVTTHHGILKNYGYTNPKCINASVEFNADTLRPTYRLLMGVPGESHAIDIALRSGLPENVVQQARDYISTEQADVSSLIKGLTAKHAELDELQQNERKLMASLEEKQLKIHEREIRNKEFEAELKEIERTNASAFLSETRKKLENLVRELREGEITRQKTLAVKDFITEMTQGVDLLEKKAEEEKAKLEAEKELLAKEKEVYAQNGMRITKAKENKSSSKKKTKQRLSNTEALSTAPSYVFTSDPKKNEPVVLKEGMEVYAGSAKRKGILIHKEKGKSWIVQFGSMKMSVKENMITPVPQDGKPLQATVYVDISKNNQGETEHPVFELRLLGMRYDEAIRALERQLDLCAIHNFKSFSIIHGKGSGVLQQGVQNYLSHYNGVKDFRFAPPEEGGSGKTYVTLL